MRWTGLAAALWMAASFACAITLSEEKVVLSDGGVSDGGPGGSGGAMSADAGVGAGGGAQPPDGNPGAGGSDAGGGAAADMGTWSNASANLVGLPSECGNMSFLASRPDRDMLIAGIAKLGLWASGGGATNWSSLGQGSGSAAIVNRTSAIVFDPEHADTFWESGIYNGPAVYKTSDNGETFIQLGSATHSDLVSVDFTDPERKTLLAGTHEQDGKLYRSTDGGKTWTDIGAQIPSGVGHSATPHVIDGQVHLLGTYRAPGSGILRSTDGGASWTKVLTGGVRGRPLVGSDRALYWLLDDDAGLVKSADQGATWSRLGGARTISTSRGGAALIELPDGRFVSLGVQQLVISADRGATWRAFGPTLPYAPVGVVHSRFRKALYIWHFTCGGNDQVVPSDAIMRLPFE